MSPDYFADHAEKTLPSTEIRLVYKAAGQIDGKPTFAPVDDAARLWMLGLDRGDEITCFQGEWIALNPAAWLLAGKFQIAKQWPNKFRVVNAPLHRPMMERWDIRIQDGFID